MKIDKSFVMGFGEPRNAAHRALRDHPRAQPRPGVTAEGVEDAAAYAALREMGCDLAQGYHIARPMPVDRATTWFREARIRTAIPSG